MTKRRGLSIALLVLLVWLVAVVWWAFRPLVDHVPTGIIDNVHTSQAVSCGSPLSGDAGTESPLPELPSERSYERTPCVSAHQQAQLLFWLDMGITVILLGVLVWQLAKAPTEDTNAVRPEAEARA
jgi:hypothetical protein